MKHIIVERRLMRRQIRIIALIAALALAQGCREREQLEKNAPALAHADLRIDRIAIVGVVSDTPSLVDSANSRERWSLLIGDRFGRERFGTLPIVSFNEVRATLGQDDHRAMLDRYKDVGWCDDTTLAALHTILEGKARFVVFGNILKDWIERSESESEVVDKKTKKTTSKTKTRTTSRTTRVRLRFYDLTDQQLAWEYLTVGQSTASKVKDMTDVIEHDPNEGFLGGLVTSIVNSAIKPDPRYPATPELETSLANAFDNVGAYLKPSKKK
jgi:hypothetical protein